VSVSPLPGVYNQVSWPGVRFEGQPDVDECWIIATYWAIVAAGWRDKGQLPMIFAFRAACGNPDKPGPTGGSNAQIITAMRGTMPDVKVVSYVGTGDGFVEWVKTRGAVASLVVSSALLPVALQFGFKGIHQVGVAWLDGTGLVLMNPLDASGHAPRKIERADLAAAAKGFLNDGLWHAVIVKPAPPDAEVADLKTQIVNLNAVVTDTRTALEAARAVAATAQAKIAAALRDLGA